MFLVCWFFHAKTAFSQVEDKFFCLFLEKNEEFSGECAVVGQYF
jgi:hypothetical protein